MSVSFSDAVWDVRDMDPSFRWGDGKRLDGRTQRMTPHDAVLAYVEAYNGPESSIYHLYADQLSWTETPFGRSGGRDVLLAAIREARVAIRDCHLDIVSIHTGEDSAVLESVWSGFDRATGKALPRTPVIWFFGYDADGRIVWQRDYSVVKGAMPAAH